MASEWISWGLHGIPRRGSHGTPEDSTDSQGSSHWSQRVIAIGILGPLDHSPRGTKGPRVSNKHLCPLCWGSPCFVKQPILFFCFGLLSTWDRTLPFVFSLWLQDDSGKILFSQSSQWTFEREQRNYATRFLVWWIRFLISYVTISDYCCYKKLNIHYIIDNIYSLNSLMNNVVIDSIFYY